MSISLAQELQAKREVSLKTWQLFLLILFANLIISWIYNEFIVTRRSITVFFRAVGSQPY